MKESPRHTTFERQRRDLAFSLALLDRRHDIERAIINSDIFSGDYASEGFFIEQFSPTDELSPYIRPSQPATFDIVATRHPSGLITYEHLAITPHDDAPLTIERHDDNLTTLHQNGEIVGPLSSLAIEATLRQLLPEQVRTIARTDQILNYIESNSPSGSSSITHVNPLGTVSFSRVETPDDSVETLGVTHTEHHPSENDIAVQLLLRESAHWRRTNTTSNSSDHTERTLTVEVQQNGTIQHDTWEIDELFEEHPRNPLYTIDTATRSHIAKINHTIKAIANEKMS